MAPAKQSTALATTGAPAVTGLQISSVDDLGRIANMLYLGGCTPPGIDNPNKVAAVLLAGLEVGLRPTQALGSIMITNGRLSIYGDGALALVRASGLLDSIHEEVSGEGDDRKGVCKITRKGESERVSSFSMGDAKRAGLIDRAKGKDGKGTGPWVSYPDRMLLMRSRGFALRDVFPDVLRGLVVYEEARDEKASEEVAVTTTASAHVPSAPPAAAAIAPKTVQVEATVDGGSGNGAKQLAAANSDPTAVTPTTPASTSPTTAAASAPIPVTGDIMVTDAQLAEIGKIKGHMVASRGIASDKAAIAEQWTALIAAYGVASAKQFTTEQAAVFIDTEGKKYDPFGHPASVSAT